MTRSFVVYPIVNVFAFMYGKIVIGGFMSQVRSPCVRRRPRSTTRTAEILASHTSKVLVEDRDVPVTNQEKLFFPAPGIAKGDLVRYYVDVAPVVLPHVRNRPMQMKRYPNGVDADF